VFAASVINPNRGADQIGKHRGECVKLRRARMLLGDIAEEYRPLFAIDQAAGNRLARCTGLDRLQAQWEQQYP
jgi:hypothetical protein